MRILFDVQRSLKVNPPTYGKGIVWLERIPVKLTDLIIVDEKDVSLQPRFKILNEQSHCDLESSFTAYGVLYEKGVMVVEKRKDGKLELISGFNRLYVLMVSMKVDTYFVDIVTFTCPQYKTLYKRSLNATTDHVATGIPNTEGTLLQGLDELKANKSFNWRDDNKSLWALSFMAGGAKTQKQLEKILKKWQETNHSDSKVRGLSTAMANKASEKLNLPFKGYCKDLSKSYYGSIGYNFQSGDFSGGIKRFVDLFDAWNTPIEIYGFIQHVVSERIDKQRESFVADFENISEWVRGHFSPKYHDIVLFKGFHAQIVSANPDDGGRALERGIVDVNGKILIDEIS